MSEAARHLVQYHNPDKMREYKSGKRGFGIVTDKPFRRVDGDRVWLISRQGKPRNYEYVLCETFIADESGPDPSGRYRYFVNGSDGKSFDPPILIDKNEEWFRRLFRVTQHFRRGLMNIRDEKVVRGLSSLAGLA